MLLGLNDRRPRTLVCEPHPDRRTPGPHPAATAMADIDEEEFQLIYDENEGDEPADGQELGDEEEQPGIRNGVDGSSAWHMINMLVLVLSL